MKIALVHDYLKSVGGAEEVLFSIHELFPEAPIFTIFSKVDPQKKDFLSQKFKNAKIIESWFGRIPFCEKLISPFRFLIPLIWKSFSFSDFDLVISSASWAVTKGFGSGSLKEICYCHTPPRYLYDYETSRSFSENRLIRNYALVVNFFMRWYDFKRAQKVDFFIANSQEVRGRIKKFYRRESTVIYPPVNVPKKKNLKIKKGDYFLTGGRLEAPKNFDLIIKACNKLGFPLKIYGVGSQEKFLRSLKRKNIEFLGLISDKEKQNLLSSCRAFIVASCDEDFGITPVEAMACGRPVIAFYGGGYLETVVEGKTGEFFKELTVESLVSVLKNFKPEKYKFNDCRKQAQKFSKEEFKKKFKEFVEKNV